MRIQKLSKLLSNQIAAGEVIERPASVIKELLENSIDAGSDRIDIDIQQGGKQLIRIRDNGCGIHSDDLPLAISRHATSKIHELNDLINIRSLGFRGEALASISSVSRFTLTSCAEGQETAASINVEGDEQHVEFSVAAHPVGTTIEIRDLFFNVPARRKFLRTDKTELAHIEECVKRLALSSPNVAIRLRNNEQTIFQVASAQSPSDQLKRIARVFSNAFLDNAVEIEREASGSHLQGWVALPTFNRSQNDLQYVYINGRYVRDKFVNHAIRQAYQDKVYPGRYPAFLLYLDLDPSAVDVNVHPCKFEVRFREARLVHDLLLTTVYQAVSGDVDMAAFQPQQQYVARSFQPSSSGVSEAMSNYVSLATVAEEPQQKISHQLGIPKAIIHNQLLITEVENGYLAIDINEAENKVRHQDMLNAFEQNKIVSRPLLLPETIQLTEKALQRINKHTDNLQTLGILSETLSATTLVVRQVPVLLQDLNLSELFNALSEVPQALQLPDLLAYLIKYNQPDENTRSVSNMDPLLISLWQGYGDGLLTNSQPFCYFHPLN